MLIVFVSKAEKLRKPVFFPELTAIIEEKNKELEQKAGELKERSPEAQKREANQNKMSQRIQNPWSLCSSVMERKFKVFIFQSSGSLLCKWR